MIEFEIFWREYPRKVGRIKAEKLWNREPLNHEPIMRGLALWKQTVQWRENCGMFVPYASTFLAQMRWADEPWTGAFDEQT